MSVREVSARDFSPRTLLGMTNSTQQQDDDPRPQPPVRPSDEDCCKGGCERCVFDLYEDALERYEADLEAWEERRKARRSAG